MKKIPCSVLIIGQNAEKTLNRCLASLTSFEEIIFIDGGSTDNTISIAKSFSNVVVYSNPWPGFIKQRNISIEKATLKWCFMIDTDEALTSELELEIKQIVERDQSRFPMYSVMRTEYLLGRPIEYGFGSSCWQERLFLRERVEYTGGVHHEHLIDGVHQNKVRHLIGFIDSKARVLHDSTYGLIDWTIKLPRFAILRAEEKIEKNPHRKVSALEVFFTFIGTFFKIYLKSYKNGKVGTVISFTTAINRCLAKLIMYENDKFGFEKEKAGRKKFLG